MSLWRTSCLNSRKSLCVAALRTGRQQQRIERLEAGSKWYAPLGSVRRMPLRKSVVREEKAVVWRIGLQDGALSSGSKQGVAHLAWRGSVVGL